MTKHERAVWAATFGAAFVEAASHWRDASPLACQFDGYADQAETMADAAVRQLRRLGDPNADS